MIMARPLLFILISAGMVFPELRAAPITWLSETAEDSGAVSNRGRLLEAANFGNAETTAPVVNGVPFAVVDFTRGESPGRLVGLSYRTGERGKAPGAGLNEIFDTLAYRSGVSWQRAMLTDLTVGQDYQVQFFYYHDTVDRQVTIGDGEGAEVILREEGQPLVATGTFTADAVSQSLSFQSDTGSQFLNAYQLREIDADPPPLLGRVLISEFMASNGETLQDGGGGSPDWIEIWNASAETRELGGWALSNPATHDAPWIFPEVSLGPGQFLLVYASGAGETGRPGELHADFTLKKEGGSLALLRPGPGGWERRSEFADYPAQRRDRSYGYARGQEEEAPLFLEKATPGRLNDDEGFAGFVGDTSFHPDRGFYEEPIRVAIEADDSEATIRYTLDGSEPTADHGLIYHEEGGLVLSRTTTLRAMAFREGYRPSNIDTQTYLFADDLVRQPDDPSGFPQSWTGADYGMEGEPDDLALIAGDRGLGAEEAREVIRQALMELPALSLVMGVDDWFDPERGIYANSTARGPLWERGCSAELIFPPGLEGEPFQIDCGVRVQGNTSRSATANPKHSLRLAFRGEYGDRKLRYSFFGDDGPREFDTIVLRSNSQDAWVYNTSRNRLGQFVRDAWARETHRRMGHASPDSNWVHLFLNGLYWGVYNPTERPDAAHGEAYYGADKEDWDAIKNHEEVLDGTISAYRELLSRIQVDPLRWEAGYRDLSDPEAYRSATELLDLEMLIDYLIHNMYAAADDWPGNYYMGYDRTGQSGGWRFFDWDNEHGMKNPVDLNRSLAHRRDRVSPTKFHHALKANPEYRLLFADRLHRAFFNGGVLAVDPEQPAWHPDHPERNVPAQLWMTLTGAIETALIAESARWGDYRRATPYTVGIDFQNLRDDLLRNWFPRRSQIVLQQFRSQGLYPDLAAPTFSRFGGEVGPGFSLALSGPEEAMIFFTDDGSDPRLAAGETPKKVLLAENSPVRAQLSDVGTFSSPWRELGFDDSAWKAGTGGVGYELIPSDYQQWIGLAVPEMRGSNRSLLVRIPFEMTAAELAELTSLTLKMRYEDGFVAYLNGERIASAQAPSGELSWDAGATSGRPDEFAVVPATFEVSGFLDLLREGENVLALQGLNDDVDSSDFLLVPQLLSGGGVGISPTARRAEGLVPIARTGVLRARSYHDGEWSALTEAGFVVEAAATRNNLVISEIMYHAAEGGAHDFVELLNVSATGEALHLGGVAFTKGIRFQFPFGTTLRPGERILVVGDRTAFEEHYGSGLPVAGSYSGRLDNGGERLVLQGSGGGMIRDFSYDDEEGWPGEADGAGASLILLNPKELPDHREAVHWQGSPNPGGSPGVGENPPFAGNAGDDRDRDSFPALLEYAMGFSDQESQDVVKPAVELAAGQLIFTYSENGAASEVTLLVETSRDLKTWRPLDGDEVTVVRGAEENGRFRVTLTTEERERHRYWRLRARRP